MGVASQMLCSEKEKLARVVIPT